jgi:hypothetical protein
LQVIIKYCCAVVDFALKETAKGTKDENSVKVCFGLASNILFIALRVIDEEDGLSLIMLNALTEDMNHFELLDV